MNIPAKNLLLTGRIFLLASALLFAGMLYYGSGALNYRSNTVETDGTIVGYTQSGTTGTDESAGEYYPVIEYHDTRGNLYRINPEIAMNMEIRQFIKSKEEGAPGTAVPPVKIRYLKNCPTEAGPAGSFIDIWGAVLGYGFLALFFSIAGTALMSAGDSDYQKK